MAVGFLVYFQLFGIFENFHSKMLGFKKNESLPAEKGKILKWPQTKTQFTRLPIVKLDPTTSSSALAPFMAPSYSGNHIHTP